MTVSVQILYLDTAESDTQPKVETSRSVMADQDVRNMRAGTATQSNNALTRAFADLSHCPAPLTQPKTAGQRTRNDSWDSFADPSRQNRRSEAVSHCPPLRGTPKWDRGPRRGSAATTTNHPNGDR